MTEKISKAFFIIIIGGVVGGIGLGFLAFLIITPLVFTPIQSVVISGIIIFFYIPSIYRQIKNKTYLVIIRKIGAAIFLGLIFSAMVVFEAGEHDFSGINFYIFLGIILFVAIVWTFYITITEMFPKTRIAQELSHTIKGMQRFGLLPTDKEIAGE